MMLSEEIIRHPDDKTSAVELDHSKLFQFLWDFITKKIYSSVDTEVFFKIKGVEVNETVYPDIYSCLLDICEKLRIPVPKLYLSNIDHNGAAVKRTDQNIIILNPDFVNFSSADSVELELVRQCCYFILFPVEKKVVSDAVSMAIDLAQNKLVQAVYKLFSKTINKSRKGFGLTLDRAAVLYSGTPEPMYRYLVNSLGVSEDMMTDEAYRCVVEDILKEKALLEKYFNDPKKVKTMLSAGLLDDKDPNIATRIVEVDKWVNSQEFCNLRACINNPERKDWLLPYSSDTVVGKSSHTVIELFKGNGFTDVSTEYSFRRDPAIHDGEVISATVDGKNNFKAGEFCDRNAPVHIVIQKRPER